MTGSFRISAVSLMITFLVTGCGTTHEPVFHKVQPNPSIDVSKIPNSVPRQEAKSRYGNPKSYVVSGRRYFVMDSARGYVETGVSSWYGPNFHGKKTSSQETYDMYKMTAAHKTLPIPSYVEVTNLRNGRKVIVRVNDRGPFHDNRIIDLSYVAAAKLGIIKTGTGLVKIRAIDPSNPRAYLNDYHSPQESHQKTVPVRVKEKPKTQQQPVRQKQLYIQLGAFSEIENARHFRARVQLAVNRSVSIASVSAEGKLLYKVRIGPVRNVEVADQVSHDLNEAGLYDHHILFQ